MFGAKGCLQLCLPRWSCHSCILEERLSTGDLIKLIATFTCIHGELMKVQSRAHEVHLPHSVAFQAQKLHEMIGWMSAFAATLDA
jgi:hypothetical protein